MTMWPHSSFLTSINILLCSALLTTKVANGCPIPVPGATTTTATTTCTGLYVTLGLEDPNPAEHTFQWWASFNGIDWVQVIDSVMPTLTVPIFADTWFRCTVTCPTSSESANSTPVLVAIDEPEVPYLVFDPTTGHAEDFEAWADRCDTHDVPATGWRNTPAHGQNSWRRHDEGISTGGWSTSGWNQNMDPEEGYAARFHSRGSADLTGRMDLFLDMSQAEGDTRMSFRFINSAGGGRLVVQQSTDGGAGFTTLGDTLGLTSPPFNTWVDVELNVTSTSPTTVLRFLAIGPPTNTGNDIGIDDLMLSAGSTIGMNEMARTGVRVYPRPASERMTAEWPGAVITEARLFDGAGRVVPLPILLMDGPYVVLDVRPLSTGHYLMELRSKEGKTLRTPVLVTH